MSDGYLVEKCKKCNGTGYVIRQPGPLPVEISNNLFKKSDHVEVSIEPQHVPNITDKVMQFPCPDCFYERVVGSFFKSKK